jgi:hypothetical protein
VHCVYRKTKFMLSKRKFLSTLIFAVLFTFLFYRQGLGVNLLIAEFALITYLFATRQIVLKGFLNISIFLLLITSLLFTLIVHSKFVFVMHFVVLFSFVGTLIFSQSKSVLTTLALAVSNIFSAQFNLVQAFGQTKIRGSKVGSILWRIKIYLIPIFIISIFLLIYRNSNPAFDQIYAKIKKFIGQLFSNLVDFIEIHGLITFVTCLLISAFFILRAEQEDIIKEDQNASDELIRKRKTKVKTNKNYSLINEYKAAVFLFVSLNVILLFLNYLDIQYVWFGFSWEGQFLKNFVHQGTYLLVFSIVIAVGLVLYLFRNNLNFFSKNKLLKILSYIWLAQNALLIFSVAQRNHLYIKHYALAYGRIGVYIFLILALFGLFTVYLKIQKKKSNFFLWRINALSALFVLTFSAFFNWDVIIAKYNFKQANKSFLHLEFLAKLSDKALPYLDYNIEELTQIEHVQHSMFSFKRHYSTPYEFKMHITEKKISFMRRWENQSWLSWNYAEFVAYEELKKKN